LHAKSAVQFVPHGQHACPAPPHERQRFEELQNKLTLLSQVLPEQQTLPSLPHSHIPP